MKGGNRKVCFRNIAQEELDNIDWVFAELQDRGYTEWEAAITAIDSFRVKKRMDTFGVEIRRWGA
jgi:hypothetical protein